MNEFDDTTKRISDVLHGSITDLDVPTVGVAAVRRRGNVRKHRLRAGVATASAVLLVAGGIVVIQRLGTEPALTTGPAAASSTDDVITSSPIDTIATATTAVAAAPGATGQPVNRIDSAFVWNAIEPGSAEAVSGLVFGLPVTENAPYFAWSTAPGPTTGVEYTPTLYRSDDGIHWTPSAGGTFTEPQVSKRGLVSQNGAMFAFGTAAATAAIPQGGAGDAVVDISNDGGATWQTEVLPLDLRSLAATDGVGSVGMSGGIAAANGIVVAVALPFVSWDAQQAGRELIVLGEGAYEMIYPNCEGGSSCNPTPTTVSGNGLRTADTATISTEPVQYAEDSVRTLSELIPFDELGIDPASVAATRTPRAFVSTDGATFAEVEFPPLPDATVSNGGDMRVFSAGGAFYVTQTITTFDPAAPAGARYVNAHLLYRSTDGTTWQQVGGTADSGAVELLGVMDDGTVVGRTYASDRTVLITTSADGEAWQAHDLLPLVDPGDGQIVYVDLWAVSVNEQGITAIGIVANDPIAEAGGRSLERDGVRLEVRSSRTGDLRAYDSDTGAEISQELRSYGDNGDMSVLNDDRTTRATFTAGDQQRLQNPNLATLRTKVLLHSDDGVNWSRENLDDLSGSAEAGPGFIQTVDGKLLVTLIDPAKRTNTMATTMVLVGTRK